MPDSHAGNYDSLLFARLGEGGVWGPQHHRSPDQPSSPKGSMAC